MGARPRAGCRLAGSDDAFVLAFSGPLGAALETGTHTTMAGAVSEVSERRAVLRFRGDPRPGLCTRVLTVVDDAGLIAIRSRRVKLA